MKRSVDQVLADLCDRHGEFADCDPLTVNSVGASGDTPLHVAMWRGDLVAAEVLLENGANVNAQGDMAETPLHVAVRQRNAAGVQLLLKQGARLEVRSEFGRTVSEEGARCAEEATDISHMLRSTESPLQPSDRDVSCSFCGSPPTEKTKSIESRLGVRICERCVSEFHERMSQPWV
jgi:ankyrin repeat protein